MQQLKLGGIQNWGHNRTVKTNRLVNTVIATFARQTVSNSLSLLTDSAGACSVAVVFRCSLTNLESLELRDNAIRSLPSSAACLTDLQLLDLGGNLLNQVVSHRDLYFVAFYDTHCAVRSHY